MAHLGYNGADEFVYKRCAQHHGGYAFAVHGQLCRANLGHTYRHARLRQQRKTKIFLYFLIRVNYT